jgi:hypothetical protein
VSYAEMPGAVVPAGGLRHRNMVEELDDRQHEDESECDKHNVHACGPVEKDEHEHGERKCSSPQQPDMCVDPTPRTSQNLQRTPPTLGPTTSGMTR